MLFFSFSVILGKGQELRISALNRVETKVNDTFFRFYAIPMPKKYSYSINKFYYNFSADSIHVTQGASAGRVLHGTFSAYYSDMNLKEQGDFKNGLKDGIWKKWFMNGSLQEVVTWKDGNKDGGFTEYNISGRKIRKGKYKNNKLYGIVHLYSEDRGHWTIKYKKGAPKKEPSNKDSPEK